MADSPTPTVTDPGDVPGSTPSPTPHPTPTTSGGVPLGTPPATEAAGSTTTPAMSDEDAYAATWGNIDWVLAHLQGNELRVYLARHPELLKGNDTEPDDTNGNPWDFTGGRRDDPITSRLGNMYFNLWGTPAPEEWLKKNLAAVTAGDKNLWEVELEQRQRPAFMHTKTAEEESNAFASQVARLLGMRG